MAQTPTEYLGQFTDENAERVADALDAAGIPWWSKTPNRLTRVVFAGDWGTRLFVERSRLDDARSIAEDVTGSPPR